MVGFHYFSATSFLAKLFCSALKKLYRILRAIDMLLSLQKIEVW